MLTLKDIIKKVFLTRTGKVNCWIKRKDWQHREKYKDVFAELNRLLPDLPIDIQIDRYLNHGAVAPLCIDCGADFTDTMHCEEYRCHECFTKKATAKRKATNLIKYGHESPNSNDAVRAKTSATNLVKYGVINPLLNKDIQTQIKGTNLSKYGTENPMQNKDVMERVRNTCVGRYGATTSLLNEEVKRKIEGTMISRHGHTTPLRIPSVKEKIKQTNLARYGCENPAANSKIIAKMRETFEQSYLSRTSGKLNETQMTLINDKQALQKLHHTQKMGLKEISLRHGIPIALLQKKLTEHAIEIKTYSTQTSLGEKFLADKISERFDLEIMMNDRRMLQGKEIDIWIPKHSLGIEYHGNWWHSSIPDDQTNDIRHQVKFLLAREKGVKLLQFFCDEIDDKQEIVLSMIGARVGRNKKIFARKCKIVEVANSVYREFCDANHIQGYATAKIRYGLEYNDRLVSIMSFSSPRFNKQHQWELIRSCTLKNLTVVGGVSKLVNVFIKRHQPESILSYADCRYSSGDGYLESGFRLERITKPSYCYVKGDLIISRYSAQKHKLRSLLEKYDDALTERANMHANGWRQRFDAGHMLFSWKFDKSSAT